MPAVGAGAPVIGPNCRLYIAQSLTSPTWGHVGKVQGTSSNRSRDVSEIKERDLDETTVVRGHKNSEFTVTLTRRPGNTHYAKLLKAFDAPDGDPDSIVPLAFMNGPITTVGVDGYQAEFVVTGWDDDQGNDSNSVNVTLRPTANYSVPPAAVVIVSGGS